MYRVCTGAWKGKFKQSQTHSQAVRNMAVTSDSKCGILIRCRKMVTKIPMHKQISKRYTILKNRAHYFKQEVEIKVPVCEHN